MATKVGSFKPVFLLTAVTMIIFGGRTLLAAVHDTARLFDLFRSLTLMGR